MPRFTKRTQRVRSRTRKLASSLQALEPRRLLTGVTLLDSFASDSVGGGPSFQVGDVGDVWTVEGTPNIGTGAASSGTAKPLNVDVGGASQWLRLDGSGESAQARFSEITSLNGSTIEFDYFALADGTSSFGSSGIFAQGQAGDLLRLEFAVNNSSTPAEISVPFEVIVNGQSTGVSGPTGDAWSHVTLTLNETDWDLSWQAYNSAAGETTTLTGPVHSLNAFSYLSGAGGGAAAVTFTDDGDNDGNGDAILFVSNVLTTDANDAPVALNDFVTTDANVNVTFNVLNNDIDDDGLTIDSFTQPASGTLVNNGSGTFTYTPDSGVTGADQFDYVIGDGSGLTSTATAYVYTSTVTGLPAYATNPNAPAVLYLDFDGDRGELPFNRAGDTTSFTAFERDLIRQSVEYTAQAFSMFDVNVTTVLTPDLPKAWMRIRSDNNLGAAGVGSFPSQNQSTGYVGSNDRGLTTALAHELGHILNVTHQSTFALDGSEIEEYRSELDGEGSIMGVDYSGNVVMWWNGHYKNQPTQLQDDLVKISTEIRSNSGSSTGFSPDDHDSSIRLATPATQSGGTWSATGVINDIDDIDTFVFDWDGGDVDVSVFRTNPYTQSNRGDPSSVDIAMSVFDLKGNLVGYSDPDSYNSNAGLDAAVTIPDLTPGSYVVSIGSHGDYADIGTYTLNVEPGTWTGSNPNANSLDAPGDIQVAWVGSDSVELTWNNVAGETGFRVERSTNNVDFTTVGTAPANATGFIDAGGLDPSTVYYYRVRSLLNNTVSVTSEVATGVTRPGAVTQLTVSEFIGTTKVLEWKVQRTSLETGFRIERSTDGVNYTTRATVGANVPSYSDTGLNTSTAYHYRVVTLDQYGDAATTHASDTLDGLIARYTFEDTTARDTSLFGQDNSGMLRNGATAVHDASRNGYVVSLDGINDYVSIPDSDDINLGTNTDRTITASFNAISVTSQQMIYEEGGTTRGYNIYIQAGLLYVGVWGMDNSVANAFLSTSIVAGQWYNVKLVNDTVAGFVTGYLDGISFGSSASDATQLHTDDIAIGRVSGTTKTHSGNTSTGSFFAGQIDDVRVYNIAHAGNVGPVSSDESLVIDNDETVVITILANDSDSDGDGLVVTGVSQGTNGSVAINANGTVTYTPSAGYFGGDSFTYNVSDNQGGSSTSIVNLTVQSTGLVARYTFDNGTADDVSLLGRSNDGSFVGGATVVNDSDRGNVLSVDGFNDYVSIPNSGDINSLTVTDRTLFLSFKADTTSGRQLIYEEGGTTRGMNIYIDSGQLYVGSWGMDGVANVFLSRVVSAGQWNHVSAQLNHKTGTVSATLNGYVIGTAPAGTMIAHTGNIGIGGVNSGTKFHTGNFTGSTGQNFAGLIDNLRLYNSSVENSLPSPIADDVTTDEDTALVVDVISNDVDTDGDALSVSAVTNGANGMVTLSGGEVTYDPNQDFFGSDSFTYSVSDGFGGMATATVTVIVDPVNDAPTAISLTNDSVAENTDTSAGLAVGDLNASDVDSASFSYSLVAGAGDVDNPVFEVVNDELRVKAGTELDFENLSQYSVRVEVFDGQDSFEQIFLIDVANLLELESPIVIGSGGQSRSILDELTIYFDETVTLLPNAFQLINKATSATVDVSVSLDDSTGKSVAKLTFSGPEADSVNGSLKDGNYELTIDGSKVQSVATGQLLDGNSDGTAGGNFTFGNEPTDEFFRLLGDINGDRSVGLTDFAVFRQTFGDSTSDPGFESGFDFDDSGSINLSDFARFRAAFGNSI